VQNKPTKKIVIIILIYVLISVFFIVIGLFIQQRNKSNSSNLVIDSYGDKIETNIYGEPKQGNEKPFTLMQNFFYYKTFKNDDKQKMYNEITNFIWNNINQNEVKAVMQETIDSKVVGNTISTSFEIRTSENKDVIQVVIIQNDSNEPTQINLAFKDKKTSTNLK